MPRSFQSGNLTRGARETIGTRRILLLEDHAALANLRRDFLMGQGYDVVCCATGEDASCLLESQPFDLLLTDALLNSHGTLSPISRTDERHSQVSGWEVAAAAKRLGVPVILSSGWPVRLSARELRKRGIDYLCPKPCSLHQLLYLVESAPTKLVQPPRDNSSDRRPVLKAQYQSHGRKSDH